MNRRGFLKGAITVGLVASIIKGRVPEPVTIGVDVAKFPNYTVFGQGTIVEQGQRMVIAKHRRMGKSKLKADQLDDAYEYMRQASELIGKPL